MYISSNIWQCLLISLWLIWINCFVAVSGICGVSFAIICYLCDPEQVFGHVASGFPVKWQVGWIHGCQSLSRSNIVRSWCGSEDQEHSLRDGLLNSDFSEWDEWLCCPRLSIIERIFRNLSTDTSGMPLTVSSPTSLSLSLSLNISGLVCLSLALSAFLPHKCAHKKCMQTSASEKHTLTRELKVHPVL